jgi:CubicO group peptidase (beta-lactamase class C family)
VAGGQVHLAVGLGAADLESGRPATADTPYDIASVTKPLSAVALLRLVEEGRIDLDAPIAATTDWAEFCREFAEQPTIFARGLVCDPPVHTLRHLLTHTAVGVPGTRFSYNPILCSWASRPVAAATDSAFSDLFARRVFVPAGMTRSARRHRALAVPANLAADRAQPYHLDSTGAFVRSPGPSPQGDGAAGGVVSTVLDLARFDRALDAGRLLRPESRDLLWTPYRANDGREQPYGLGWFVEVRDGRRLAWHSGLWEGAWSALYLKLPDEGLALILLANSDGLWWDNPRDDARVIDSPFARLFLTATR